MNKKFCFVFWINLALISFESKAQIDINFIDSVNTAVNKLDYLHLKTKYFSKPYTSEDTIVYNAETWIHKTAEDTVLGMHIRSAGRFNFGNIETLHKGTKSWIINHDSDSIKEYDQLKGHWDGFSGNFKVEWTNESPIITGIPFNLEDSIAIIELENGDLVLHHVSEDLMEYSITNIEDWFYIKRDSYLPYRAVSRWELEGRVNFSDLHIELIDSTASTVLSAINKEFPNYPIVEYSPPNPDLFKPLKTGVYAPEMKGELIQSGGAFDLSNYLKDKLVMIDFWYQSCGPCIRAIPYLDSLLLEYQDRGFSLFEVNSRDHNTSKEDLIEFVKKRGGNPKTIVMTDLETEQKVWKCYANPTFYLIKDQRIVWVQQGFSPELMSEFRLQIEKHIN